MRAEQRNMIVGGLAALAAGGVIAASAAPAQAYPSCRVGHRCSAPNAYYGHHHYGYGPGYYAPGPAPVIGGIIGGLTAGALGAPYYNGSAPYYSPYYAPAPYYGPGPYGY